MRSIPPSFVAVALAEHCSSASGFELHAGRMQTGRSSDGVCGRIRPTLEELTEKTADRFEAVEPLPEKITDRFEAVEPPPDNIADRFSGVREGPE